MTKLKMSGMKARGDDFANVEPVLAVSVSSIGILRSVGDGARAVTSPSVGVKPAGCYAQQLFKRRPLKWHLPVRVLHAASQCGLSYSISACARTADIQIRVSVK
jgi:hypothetical protein